MPVFKLNESIVFPPPSLAEEDGLLAIGGDLSTERLLKAYEMGIFPWYSEGEPILWWSPNPRFILYPENINISKSMKKLIKKNIFRVKYDTCFKEVMTMCGKLREDKEGTWINEQMIEAYTKLYEQGIAHSVETWYGEKLVGGLYGLSLGKCFFGESMFSTMDNSSKFAIINLSNRLSEYGFSFIDCQVYSKHLESLGAVSEEREKFLELLRKGLNQNAIIGKWTSV